MENSKPFVSVIVLNWNGKKYLNECLDALNRQTYKDFEVIVVDNGSIDGSADAAVIQYSDFIRLIKNSENLGFAEGNNVGIRHSRGDYVITLNNDTRVDDHWLEELVMAAENDRTVGMCASKILFLEKPGLIDSVGINIYPDGMSKQRGHLEKDKGQYDKIEEILLPSACAALYKRTMLDEIGFFDKDFFIYCDDTDLGLRGRLSGWKALYIPSAVVYHVYSGTMGAYSPRKAYLVERNHYWTVLKTFPLGLLLSLPFYTLIRIYTQSKSALFYSDGKNIRAEGLDRLGVLIALSKAYASVVASLPCVIKKRRAVRKMKKVDDSEIYSWFKRFGMDVRELALNRMEE